jgi:hypothetical protein
MYYLYLLNAYQLWWSRCSFATTQTNRNNVLAKEKQRKTRATRHAHSSWLGWRAEATSGLVPKGGRAIELTPAETDGAGVRQGLTPQICSAYSLMVRSLLNLPLPAVLAMHILAHWSLARKTSSARD